MFLFPNNFSPSKKIFRVCALKKLCKNNIVIFFPTKYRQRKKSLQSINLRSLCNKFRNQFTIFNLLILVQHFENGTTSKKSLRKYNAKRGCNLLQENALPYETRYSITKHVSQTKS